MKDLALMTSGAPSRVVKNDFLSRIFERQMKYIAIGRKNYYFAGSHEGAHCAAVVYSLLGACRLNEVNPWEWLSDELVRVNVPSEDTAVSRGYFWNSPRIEDSKAYLLDTARLFPAESLISIHIID